MWIIASFFGRNIYSPYFCVYQSINFGEMMKRNVLFISLLLVLLFSCNQSHKPNSNYPIYFDKDFHNSGDNITLFINTKSDEFKAINPDSLEVFFTFTTPTFSVVKEYLLKPQKSDDDIYSCDFSVPSDVSQLTVRVVKANTNNELSRIVRFINKDNNKYRLQKLDIAFDADKIEQINDLIKEEESKFHYSYAYRIFKYNLMLKEKQEAFDYIVKEVDSIEVRYNKKPAKDIIDRMDYLSFMVISNSFCKRYDKANSYIDSLKKNDFANSKLMYSSATHNLKFVNKLFTKYPDISLLNKEQQNILLGIVDIAFNTNTYTLVNTLSNYFYKGVTNYETVYSKIEAYKINYLKNAIAENNSAFISSFIQLYDLDYSNSDHKFIIDKIIDISIKYNGNFKYSKDTNDYYLPHYFHYVAAHFLADKLQYLIDINATNGDVQNLYSLFPKILNNRNTRSAIEIDDIKTSFAKFDYMMFKYNLSIKNAKDAEKYYKYMLSHKYYESKELRRDFDTLNILRKSNGLEPYNYEEFLAVYKSKPIEFLVNNSIPKEIKDKLCHQKLVFFVNIDDDCIMCNAINIELFNQISKSISSGKDYSVFVLSNMSKSRISEIFKINANVIKRSVAIKEYFNIADNSQVLLLSKNSKILKFNLLNPQFEKLEEILKY